MIYGIFIIVYVIMRSPVDLSGVLGLLLYGQLGDHVMCASD
jgi:hypothetical protein